MQDTQSRKTIWRPGDEPGQRLFKNIGKFTTESGATLPDVTVAFEAYGTPNAQRSNVILVLHGFTGDSHAAGPVGPGHVGGGWWNEIIGPGKALDTDRFCVVVPNVLGGCQGTTGPGSLDPDGKPWGSRFPKITIRDMVDVERRLVDSLRVDKLFGLVGVSLGGQRAIEWGVQHSDRIEHLVIVGSNAVASADQIATQSIQIELITGDPNFHNGDYYDVGNGRGPVNGMALARKVGHMTYRTEEELALRFGNRTQTSESAILGNGQFQVVSYLNHAAQRLEERFDPNTYVVINEAMNSHDVGRDRGGIEAALARVTTRVDIVSIQQDRLFPPYQQELLVELIGDNAKLHEIFAREGHDAFLTADTSMSAILRQPFLTLPISLRVPELSRDLAALHA